MDGLLVVCEPGSLHSRNADENWSVAVKVIYSDWNGTLYDGSSFKDLATIAGGNSEAVWDSIARQTEGNISVDEAVTLASRQIKGLSLWQLINYGRAISQHAARGYSDFLSELKSKDISLVINSTGYIELFEVIVHKFEGFFSGYIGNSLVFGYDGDLQGKLTPLEVKAYIDGFFSGKMNVNMHRVKATGDAVIRVRSAEDKARHLRDYTVQFFEGTPLRYVAHMGDTSGGDLAPIHSLVTEFGGTGIGFAASDQLIQDLYCLRTKQPRGTVFIVDPYEPRPDLRKVSAALVNPYLS